MRLLKLLFAIAIFLALAIVAYAHPGRTDSAGGHTNHSTGEYHYHHGYSAHQHYDKDGDGTLDCPYSFNDKTGSSSSGSKSSSKTPSQSSTKTNPQKETMTLGQYVAIAVMLGVVWIYVSALFSPAIEAIKRLFKR